jgi:hypothetical protein
MTAYIFRRDIIKMCDNFQSFALAFHNNYALVLGNYVARILELELYKVNKYGSETLSIDPYTHGNEKQLNPSTPNEGSVCSFYIHRSAKLASSNYKGGTYKGIDITLPNNSILIRSLQLLSLDGTYIEIVEGPSLVVDKLCSLMNWSLQELETQLKLVECTWPSPATSSYIGARAGLSFKNVNNAHHYVAQLRSSIIIPKKYKETFFTSPGTINRSDIPFKTTKHKEQWKQGLELQSLVPELSQTTVAAFLSK